MEMERKEKAIAFNQINMHYTGNLNIPEEL